MLFDGDVLMWFQVAEYEQVRVERTQLCGRWSRHADIRVCACVWVCGAELNENIKYSTWEPKSPT